MLFEKDFSKTYQYLSQKYSEDVYGQYSLMEMGKLSYFSDDFPKAISYFKKIFIEINFDKFASKYFRFFQNQSGIVKKKVEPTFNSEVTQILPPSSSIIFLLIESPSPAPR